MGCPVSDSADDLTLAGSSSGDSAPRMRASTIEPGAVVGRHVVLQRIGAGGMGVVFAAYDPELDRKVALKLLLPETGGDSGRARLLREAQALARLAHPNVVGIHDVGTVSEQVWLAMEFVQGQTLGRWLDTPRSWREVLEVLRSAGEGLAAAHAVSLLHRDFKPDNVMVGDDGRVRVMDFGLARVDAKAASLGSEPSQSAEVPDEAPSHSSATSVTKAGTVVGTPGYMAPEQFANVELTAAVDQFAFCVTLWEALYGERPFAGRSPLEIAASVIEGRLRSPTKGRAVPGWLRCACERGLLAEPTQRWPSMIALLDTLAKGRMRAGVRKGLVTVGVLALLVAGVEARRRWDIAQRTSACEATGAEVGAAWNDERKQALHAALVATGVSYAPATADKVMPWLDRQAVAWSEARVEACLDADVRGRWDAETLDRSLWCLDERRMQLESLIDELTLADAEVLRGAVTAAAGLASVAACRDAEILEGVTPPPPADREALRDVRADVVRAKNLQQAGRYDKGLELTRGALARAEALAWPPLVAAARMRLGWLLDKSGAYPEAEAELERAYFQAIKGVAPEVAFEAALGLVDVVGVQSARHADGLRWARLADAALEDVPDGEHLLRARLLDNLAAVHEEAGEYDEAKALYEQFLAIMEATLGPEHPLVAMGLNDLANVHYAMGAHEQAAPLYERARAILEAALGPEHLDVASNLNNLAAIREGDGDHEGAKRLYERALAIREAALGPQHPDVATSLNNLATVHEAIGDSDEAKVLYGRAVAILEATVGPQHPRVAVSLSNLANIHVSTGDYDEAKVLHKRACAILEAALGPEHPHVATGLNNLAKALEETGEYDEAKPLHERALVIWEAALGPEHANVAYSLLGLARVALAQHRPVDALPLAVRAVAIVEKGSVSVRLLAQARHVLARALWEAPVDGGRDPQRAVALAEQARDAFRGAGSAKELAVVEQWLGEHRSEP